MGPRPGAAEAGAAQTPPKTLAFAAARVAAPRRRALPGGQRRTADEPSVVPARATGRCSASETEDVPLRVAARPDLEVAGRLKRARREGTNDSKGQTTRDSICPRPPGRPHSETGSGPWCQGWGEGKG